MKAKLSRLLGVVSGPVAPMILTGALVIAFGGFAFMALLPNHHNG